MSDLTPTIMPLGDTALLVRYATRLDDAANRAAIDFAHRLGASPPAGTLEIVPNLVSVLVRYDPAIVGFAQITGELRLALGAPTSANATAGTRRTIVSVRFGSDAGPDLEEVADTLGMSVAEFIQAHNAKPLRVLATGFAPGFVYCGMHDTALHVPRRHDVRPNVPAGTILFAAGQTAITATPIPTGWHVIGSTDFRNFNAASEPPTKLHAGDEIVFEDAH